MVNQLVLKRVSKILLIVGPLATLAVSPATNFDPINLIKILVISSIAFSVLGLILGIRKDVLPRLENRIWIAAGIFLISLFFSILFSGAPFTQQIWGIFGRNTGFLTYFSLLIILLSVALIQNLDFYRKLLMSLIVTAIPMTIYCVIQVAGLDPISWSEKAPFGTLGNINFSSGFFGLSSIACSVITLDLKLSRFFRFFILIMSLIDLMIVYKTGSIQGLMIYIAGVGIAIFIYINKNNKLRFLQIPYCLIALIAILTVILGLTNKGPLSKFLFAPSIVFRGDYWHAGWDMTLKHPLFGVGLDSYGDWYRSARGILSTVRNNPDRISNTAHNIFLDISSNGGILMIASYLFFILFAFVSSIKYIRRNSEFNPIFVALFCTWLGYQIFAAISINQIGVGIWGWLFTGALIGYERVVSGRNNLEGMYGKKAKSKGNSTLPAGVSLLSFFTFSIGFVLAFIPINADASYKKASASRDMLKIVESVKLLGSTSFHSDMALDLAIRSNLLTQAKEISDHLSKTYPRDYFVWRAIYFINTSTPEEKAKAVQMMQSLDPFNPNNPKS